VPSFFPIKPKTRLALQLKGVLLATLWLRQLFSGRAAEPENRYTLFMEALYSQIL